MKAEYIDHMGDDLRVVNAARVSFDKESAWESVPTGLDWYQEAEGVGPTSITRLPERDVRLIGYLARHGHWTPFAHPQITIRETVPIFVARQRFKHMVGFIYNEVSRRYVDDTPEFFVPDAWRSRPDGSVKQGSGAAVNGQLNKTTRYVEFLDRARELYDTMLAEGIAPEQARMVLPQSMMTSYYVTGSLAAWARAYKLRADSHSQKEIQDLAKQWGEIIRPLFPVSWDALTATGNNNQGEQQ